MQTTATSLYRYIPISFGETSKEKLTDQITSTFIIRLHQKECFIEAVAFCSEWQRVLHCVNGCMGCIKCIDDSFASCSFLCLTHTSFPLRSASWTLKNL
jgi:hypothetical protein